MKMAVHQTTAHDVPWQIASVKLIAHRKMAAQTDIQMGKLKVRFRFFFPPHLLILVYVKARDKYRSVRCIHGKVFRSVEIQTIYGNWIAQYTSSLLINVNSNSFRHLFTLSIQINILIKSRIVLFGAHLRNFSFQGFNWLKETGHMTHTENYWVYLSPHRNEFRINRVIIITKWIYQIILSPVRVWVGDWDIVGI